MASMGIQPRSCVLVLQLLLFWYCISAQAVKAHQPDAAYNADEGSLRSSNRLLKASTGSSQPFSVDLPGASLTLGSADIVTGPPSQLPLAFTTFQGCFCQCPTACQ
ncbi:hypothetical protein WJX72_008248 [[Myrmecia] bisecta]|uniref:Uncharacterized protein n=1 Tax=[Myrmecia] bisecta TaxID=41462 RepID=A0AAW1P3K6_9CHLO